MTIINLVTDKTVDTTTFTDSQISVKLSNVVAGQEYTIVSRFSNYQDLFKILAIVDILRANYAGNISRIMSDTPVLSPSTPPLS